MCDFRNPPEYVINPKTGELERANFCGIVGINKQIADWGKTISMQEVTQNGVYYIAATGSGYRYFYNGQWYGYDYMKFNNNDSGCGCGDY